MLLKRHAPSAIEKKKKFRIKSPEKNIENQSIFSSGSSPHETFILNLLKKPFKNPLPNFVSSKTTKSLGIRRLQAKVALHDPNQENALVLYRPKKANVLEKKQEIIADVAVVVDPILSDILRPHQKEGVKFMYESITGIYDSDTLKITGCVMADEMGLGKTLQCVSLVWTLLTQSPTIYPPMIHNSVIVCPSSLVKNWNNEFSKWLGNRICCEMIADSGKALIDKKIKNFLSQVPPRNAVKVLIISYETLRGHREAFETHTLGIMICDEGHRLKNCDNQTYMALHTLKTKYRILLSGTPIQNDLGELYSLLNFVNPGLLGSSNDFKKNYELPILKAREEICTEKIKQVGESKLEELIDISRRCVIRRTQALLTKFLPLKFENIICIKFSSLQQKIYSRVYEELSLESNKENLEAGNGQAKSLAAITQLKKICNHPCLVDDNTGQKQKLSQKIEDSGKLMVLDIMLAKIRNMTNDRVVLISNYTQTMDLFEELCKVRNYSFVRLDGTINSKKRQELVTRLNEPDSKVFVFMLSSKAGGCGLNLIGANRLFMFDPDWNPANDDQAMARVWRDGQKKTSFIYRFVCSGTIEELILQRQINKLALSDCVIDQLDTTHPAEFRKDISQSRINADKEKTEANGPADNLANCSMEQLHALSDYNSKTKSYLHDELRCKRCISGIQSIAPPENSNCKDGIRDWHHCYSYKDLPDDVILKGTMMLPKIPINMIFYQKSHDVIK